MLCICPCCLSTFHNINSSYLLISYLKSVPPPFLPFGNHKFVFCICESVSVLHIHSFVLFFKFHIQVISYSTCHSLTYFPKHSVFQDHPYYCKWQSVILRQGSIPVYHTYIYGILLCL